MDYSYDFILAVEQDLREKSQYRFCQFKTDRSSITITKYGQPVNLFRFYESPEDSEKLGSIAIYGLYLKEYYSAIKQARSIFGLEVESVELDAGFDDFLDIYLKLVVSDKKMKQSQTKWGQTFR